MAGALKGGVVGTLQTGEDKTMQHKTITRLCDAYEATGRVAFIYPRKKLVSLNGGRTVKYEEAAHRIKICLQRKGKTMPFKIGDNVKWHTDASGDLVEQGWEEPHATLAVNRDEIFTVTHFLDGLISGTPHLCAKNDKRVVGGPVGAFVKA